jgi:hypothetical protein
VLGGSVILMDLLGITGVGWAWLGSQSLVAVFLLAVVLRSMLKKGG